jgi:hypothetical protein
MLDKSVRLLKQDQTAQLLDVVLYVSTFLLKVPILHQASAGGLSRRAERRRASPAPTP